MILHVDETLRVYTQRHNSETEHKDVQHLHYVQRVQQRRNFKIYC